MDEIKDARDKEKYAESLLNTEDNIGVFEEKGNRLYLDFMFIKSTRKDFFDIMRYVEDVPPSWIKEIHDALKKIKDKPLFEEEQLKKILGKKHTGGLNPYLGELIRPFFPSPSYDKYFIEITASILAQKTIDKHLLIRAFMREIRDRHIDNKTWEEKFFCLKAFMLLLLIAELKLCDWMIQLKEETKLTQEIDYVKRFMQEYNVAFDTPAKQASFLLGVLTKHLLDIQFAKRGSTPFRSKLSGLRLDENKMKRLFREIIEKLAEYDVAYIELQKFISKAFVETENQGWGLTKDEISYYFTLGLNLGGIFK
jgi:CRISPR-associated protein Csh1